MRMWRKKELWLKKLIPAQRESEEKGEKMVCLGGRMMKLTSCSIFRNDQRWYGFSCWSKLRYKTFEFCNEKKEKRREERKRCWRKEREDLVIRQDNCETKKNVTERKGPEGACFCFSFSWSFVYFHSNCAPSFSFVGNNRPKRKWK